YSPPPTLQPWGPKPKPQRPYRVLAEMLIGCALAFPGAAIGILVLLALGGESVITATDARGIAKIAAVVAGLALVATAAVWADRSRDLSRRARSIGWLLLPVAAVPGVVGAVYLLGASSPRNLVRPSVRGRAEVGSVLRVDPGRWTNSVRNVDVQWQ